MQRVSTRGSTKAARVQSVSVKDGDSQLTLRALGGGPVRLFGVALERDKPGIVYDALGSHAAMAAFWQKQDPTHWREQIRRRDAALVILQYGTNESDLWRLDRDEYEHALADLVEELHQVADGASVLVVAPLDRAATRDGKPVTKRVIVDLVALQRRVALAHRAAFWNTFDSMGGEGSIARWHKTKPELAGADLTHPTPLGAEVLGDMLSDAIVKAFATWSETTASRAH